MRLLTDAEVIARFGKFTYSEATGGRIIITDRKWLAANIEKFTIPIIGNIWAHFDAAMSLFRIFHWLEVDGKADLVDVGEFKKNIAGVWVPRHKFHNSKRGLSRHSWGIAIDLNVKDNPVGAIDKQPAELVKRFEAEGWYWGGNFAGMNRDPMHFEVGDTFKTLQPIPPDVKTPYRYEDPA